MPTLFKRLGALAIVAALAFPLSAEAARRVEKRQGKQDARIEQGKKTGELTPKEARKLEREQRKIQREKARMASDGKIDAREKAKLERDQDKASRHIYKQKHDKQRMPRAK